MSTVALQSSLSPSGKLSNLRLALGSLELEIAKVWQHPCGPCRYLCPTVCAPFWGPLGVH